MEAVILAAGSGMRIRAHHWKPKGFIELGGTPIIAYSIDAIRRIGIERITLVVGYHADFYEALAGRIGNIQLVSNPKFATLGSLYSLLCASPAVHDDFVLLDSDLIYEPRALEQIIATPAASALLVADISGSGDESYVEAEGGYAIKVSKDRSTLDAGKIVGEMVGITKISYSFFLEIQRACADLFGACDDAHSGYEDGIMLAAQRIPVPYLKLGSLLWSETDTIDQLAQARRILPEIARSLASSVASQPSFLPSDSRSSAA